MANLGTFEINTNNEYVNLETLTGLTFTNGTSYTIQIQNTAFIREGTTGDGFIISDTKPFVLKYQGDDVYIRTPFFFPCTVNIATA